MAHHQPKVMVVDDDPGMRVTLEAIIEDEGYDVVGVADGYQAIELAGQTSFDLIFMDIKMPGINGVETYQKIKRVSPRSVVVMMTGFSVEDLIEEAMKEGACAVIYKPFAVEQILEIMKGVLRTTCVLVVDDLETHRGPMRALLDEVGYEVIEAHDGEQAVSSVQKSHYDVILMDVKMPDLDGVAAYEQISKIDPHAKVIFITGYVLDDSVSEALRNGAHSVLTKPVDPEKLLLLMKSIIQSRAKSGQFSQRSSR